MLFSNDDFLNWVFDRAHVAPFNTERHPLDLHPSSPSAMTTSGQHFGECIKALWYKKTGAAPDPSAPEPAGNLIMDCGTWLGKMLAGYFQLAGVGIAPNGPRGEQDMRIYRKTARGTEYRINGYIDVLAAGPNGEVIGYEFKTVWGSNKANRVIHGWRVSAEPDMKNLLQIALYAWYGRTKLGIHDWRLTYLWVDYDKSRSNPLGRTYNITVDDKNYIYVDGVQQEVTIDDILRQYDRLADALAFGEEPDREGNLFYTEEQVQLMDMSGDLTKKQEELLKAGRKIPVAWSPCTFCDYVGTCWGQTALKELRP